MSKQVLSIEQMHHLKELGVDTSKASMCHYKVFFSYNFGKETSTEWDIDFLDNRYTTIDGKIILTPKNFMGIPDNDGRDFSDVKDIIPAFTLQDVLDFLPDKIMEYQLCTEKIKMSGDFRYRVSYKNNVGCYLKFFIEDELIDSAYEMLCWCIDKGYLKTKYHGS